MATVNHLIHDTALQYIADNGDELNLCSDIPTTYAEATSTYMLAQITGMTSGDYSIANGDINGRKVTLSGQTGLSVIADGMPIWAAITSSGLTELLAVTPCTSQTLYIGNIVNTKPFKIEISDPA